MPDWWACLIDQLSEHRWPGAGRFHNDDIVENPPGHNTQLQDIETITLKLRHSASANDFAAANSLVESDYGRATAAACSLQDSGGVSIRMVRSRRDPTTDPPRLRPADHWSSSRRMGGVDHRGRAVAPM